MARFPRNTPLLVAGLLVLSITLAVYAGTLSAAFVDWDDGITIFNNKQLGDLSLDRIAWALTDVATTMRWIPLTLLSLTVTHTIHGLDPFGYHLVNWLLHGATALLVFLLLRELLARAAGAATAGAPAGAGTEPGATADSAPARDGHWLILCAAAGALAWSLHPLRVEVEAWSNSRGHAQSGLFVVLALLLYARGHRAGAPARPWRVAAWSSLAFMAALLSHPIAIGAAPMFVLLDLYLGRLGGQAGWWNPAARRVMLEKVPFGLVAALVLGVSLLIRTFSSGIWPAPVPLSTWGLFPRAVQATYIYVHYVLVTLWPVGLQPAPVELIDFDPWTFTFLFRAALVVAVTAAAFLLRRRWKNAFLLWLAWLSLLVPALGLMEHPMFACDRYTYQPGLVPAAALAGVLLWLGSARTRRAAVAAGAAVLLALWGGMTVVQARVWSNSVALFHHMLPLIGDNPYRVNIWLFLGYAEHNRRNWPAAEAAYLQVLPLAPLDPDPRRLLADVIIAQGRTQDALPYLEFALKYHQADAALRCQVAGALVASGRTDEARAQARIAFNIDPNEPCSQRLLTRLQGH